MSKPLDLTKPLQARDGRLVTLITTAGREPYPLHGYIGDSALTSHWKQDGHAPGCWLDDPGDLVNAPEKPATIVRYLNRYQHGKFFNVTEQPPDWGERFLTESIRVEFTEGQIDD